MLPARSLALLGATGSIGASTLKVLRLHRDRFQLFAVSAHSQTDLLLDICREFQPRIVALTDARAEAALRAGLTQAGLNPVLLIGADSLVDIAQHPDIDTVVAAVVGAAGLPSTLAAATAGKRILLANKESLVIGGALVTRAAQASGALLLPVDSEHNALFQCLPQQRPLHAAHGVRALWLTASGGPFLQTSAAELAHVTPAQACAHPRWRMGRKISVDSATLMNKGLEVIEAHWLFALDAAQIKVVVHPQSTLHGLVEYSDGSFLAQLGSPDMCTPIAHALAWPERIDAGVQALDLLNMASLAFQPPDHARFPALGLAYEALQAGPAACVVLNAANEVAVERFLNGALRFQAIPQVINTCLQSKFLSSAPQSEVAHELDAILALDSETRRFALQHIQHAFPTL